MHSGFLLGGWLCAASVAFALPTPSLVVLTGDLAPIGEDVSYQGGASGISAPTINRHGAIVFDSIVDNLPRSGQFPPNGIFASEGPASRFGAWRTIIASDQELPGSDGATTVGAIVFYLDAPFDAFSNESSINDRGDVTFRSIATGSVATQGVWTQRAGGDLEVTWARGLTPAPGVDPGFVVVSGFRPSLAQNGDVLVSAFLQDVSTPGEFSFELSIFRDRGSGLEPVLASGGSAPGTEGGSFVSLGSSTGSALWAPSWDMPEGRFAVSARLEVGTGDINASNDAGVWVGSDDGVSLLVREGMPAPGFDGAVFEGAFGRPQISRTGEVLFTAQTAGGSNAAGFWHYTDSGGVLLAELQSEAPGAEGGVFDTIVASSFGAPGQLLTLATLTQDVAGVSEDNDQGLWFADSGDLSLVMREGDAAPGIEDREIGYISVPLGTSDSLFVFTANLLEEGTGDFAGRALWMYTPYMSAPAALVASGDEIDVSLAGDGSDIRTVDFVDFDQLNGLADNGWLGYTLQFTDGTAGVFTVQVPAPGALTVAAFVPLALRKRRV